MLTMPKALVSTNEHPSSADNAKGVELQSHPKLEMSFVIAFFRHSSTADVVPASAVNGEVRRGVTTKIRWGGRAYIAKVGLVTADGELTDEPFDDIIRGQCYK
ncbi:hypothetical protein Q1695_001261 [Nippostrongylus brasiliensis]|nr:hypothetical protein Q1695_001261 [Nippostrongylus brasiliensis]